jgi:threonine/homoserine/homoserine lactone efflux protein
MLDLTRLPLFLVASAVLIATPGPAALYIITRSVSQGRRVGLISVAGIETGNLCQVTACALGLSALLLSSPVAFTVVRYAGAGYIVFLGIRCLLPSRTGVTATATASAGLHRAYLDGLVVALLNPRTALFFIAFLPQFADPARGHMPLQLLLLGGLFVLLAIVGDGLYALLSGTIGKRMATGGATSPVGRYLTAATFLGLGLFVALSGRG